jgi:glycosyltransferase involved in cell wall biosynthesis
VARLGIGDQVVFAGRVTREDLPSYFARADVYVSPALGGESFGIVLLEAMASGAPVIASDIPGYDEVVRHGIDGLLVPPGDVPALSKAILRMLTESGLADRFSAAGTARAAEFAWPEIARRTATVYTEARAAQTRSSTSP